MNVVYKLIKSRLMDPASYRGNGIKTHQKPKGKLSMTLFCILVCGLFCMGSGTVRAQHVDNPGIDGTGVDAYGAYVQFNIDISDQSGSHAAGSRQNVTTGRLYYNGTQIATFSSTNHNWNNTGVNVSITSGFGTYSTSGSDGESRISLRWYITQDLIGKSLSFSSHEYVTGYYYASNGGDDGAKGDQGNQDWSGSATASFSIPDPDFSFSASKNVGNMKISYIYGSGGKNGVIGSPDPYTVMHWINSNTGAAVTDNTNQNATGALEMPISNSSQTYTFNTKATGKDGHLSYTSTKAISVPAYIWPTALNAKYDGRDSAELSWTVPIPVSGSGFVTGDNFELQRSTDATFATNTKTVASYAYDPLKSNYSVSDNLSDITGGSTLYYRLRRTATQGDWNWNKSVKTDLAVSMNTTQVTYSVVDTTVNGSPQALITWKPFVGVWTKGTTFSLIKFNKTTSMQSASISLTEAQARSGKYIDPSIPYCNEFTYSIVISLGGGYNSPPEADINGSIVVANIGTISDLMVSKGYFEDRTELNWNAQGLFDNYIILRKIYGSTDKYVQIASIPGSGTTSLQADDSKGMPGTYYQYMVVGAVNCNNKMTYSKDTLYAVGFRSPTGSIYGRIVYGNGQAVENASVRLQANDNTKLGQSIFLNGNASSYLKVDSLHTPFIDSAFTIEAWIKPTDASPKSQVIFSRKGQYELGFNVNGEVYFSYNGHTITGKFTNPNGSYIHVAGINGHDSLAIMLNDSVIAQMAVPYSPTTSVDKVVYIGANWQGNNFKGYIDEMRAWNSALSFARVARDYTRLLAGNENNLVAYWRFDETITDQFYDISHNSNYYNRNEGVMDPAEVQHTVTIPTIDQLSLKAYSDATGSYMISGVPFAGNGTTYSIVPLLGTHQFDPTLVNRLLSPTSTAFTVDFTDKSSFPVSGYVYYRNSTVPVQGAQFLVDNNYAQQSNGDLIQTDATGKFTISVPIGVHEVRAVKANHIFANSGKITDRFGADLNYQAPVSERILYDSTTIRFIGRVAGGAVQEALPLGHSLSKNNLGEKLTVTLELVGVKNREINASGVDSSVIVKHFLPSNQKDTAAAHRTRVEYNQYSMVIHPDSITGEFFADVIPENFTVKSVTATGHDDLVASSPVNIDFSNAYAVLKDGYSYSDSTSNGINNYADTVAYNAMYKFILRNKPVISVIQSDITGKAVDYFGDTTYAITTLTGASQPINVYDPALKKYLFGYPVWTQNKQYTLNLKAYETYNYFTEAAPKTPVSPDNVPTQDGLVSIVNNLEDGGTAPDTLSLDSTGRASYSFYPGTPELSDGVGRKGFSVSIKIGSQTIQWNGGKMLEGYVMGGKKTGNDFVTGGPDKSVFVLRDPPGANSFSTLATGTSFTTTSEYEGTAIQDGDINITTRLAPKVTTWIGVGTGVINQVSPVTGNTGTISHSESYTGTNTKVTTSTLLTSFQTSSDPIYVGAEGDVFIGNSTNIVCSNTLDLRVVLNKDVQNTDVVFWDGTATNTPYSIVQRTGINIGQTFGTQFAYPQTFITGTFIPGLEKLRNSFLLPNTTSASEAQTRADNLKQEVYVSKLAATDPNFGASNRDTKAFGQGVALESWSDGSSYKIYFPKLPNYNGTDTILYLNQSIENWKDRLADNEKVKIDALNNKTGFLQNYSFTGGSSVSQSFTSEYTSSKANSFKFIIGGGLATEVGAEVNDAGVVAEITENVRTEQGGNFSDGNTQTKEFDFTMDDYLYNYLSVDVYRGSDSSYLFITKGGQTACPYEGPTVSQYYNPGTIINQPTVQVEVPKITVEQSVVSDVPSNKQASFTLHMHNDTKVEGDGWFGLKVLDNSNPYGAVIYMDGNELGTGRTILVPSGEILTKTITLKRGPDSMSYNNIKVVLYSLCETTKIGDTVDISAQFMPSCSTIDIKAPTDKWVLNTSSPVDANSSYYLPITLDNFDVNHSQFDHIELQYKPASDAIWITAMKFYSDSAKYKAAQGGKQLITDNGSINYNLIMNDGSFSDQNYNIRAVSFCMDNGQVISTSQSAVINGIKDTYTPRLFGSPQPANGVLGVGDDIRLNFNEAIAAGLLSHNDFKVTGVRNGAQGDHSVSVNLDGQSDYLASEFDKNLTGKDITVELWLLAADHRSGTIFSQGDLNNSMELSLTADNHLQVKLGTKTIVSDGPVNYQNGQWAHVAMEYNAAQNTVSAFYNYVEVIHEVPVPPYTGIGHFEFGRSVSQQGNYLAGQVHGARIWSKIVTPINLQVRSLTLLSGSEDGLLAYYPMNEGKGGVAFEKAHGSNARLIGHWSTPAGKSIALNGHGYVKMNTAAAPVTAAMDYTIGLWFKAPAGHTDATLVSNGKGDGTDYGSSANFFNLGFENGILTFENNGFKVRAAGNYLDNAWHHVAITVNRNSGMAQIYMDGILNAYADAKNLGGIAAAYTYVGARAWLDTVNNVTLYDRYFTGYVDELRIWNTYLNQTLIDKNDNVRLAGNELGLLVYYPFETYFEFQNNKEMGFTLGDMTIQTDPGLTVPDAVAVNATQADEKAPIIDRGPVDNLQFDYVVNNDALIINMLEPKQTIDKSIITLQVKNVRDMNGNPTRSPITWTAYINQNQLKWSDDALDLSKDVYAKMQFQSYVVNSGGSVQKFRLDNLPPWLQASPVAGTIAPLGKQLITFTVNSGINVGTYDELVYMHNDNDEIASLPITLKVKGKEPDWKVNPADFKYSMTVFGKIRINNILSSDSSDKLAAFVNGKCVGVANNSYNTDNDFWYTFLTVYSNLISGEKIEFRIWDASTGKIYAAVPPSPITFSNDAVIGTTRDPVIFDAKEILLQNIGLVQGWNWISFGLSSTNLSSVNATLANGSWHSGDIVKDNTVFDQYSSTGGWVGSLAGFNNTSLFMLNSEAAQTLSVSGTAMDITKVPIEVKGGRWNYISYLPG
ncbi:MAG TPA: LamG domain-containing protein, partial [Arachidicoccus sp.]|nr:LamG domain-containing protein [Arachidicoccus sp.]